MSGAAERDLCKAEGHKWDHQGTYSRCERCGKTKRNSAAPVKVIRPIKETGEIIEQTVPAGHFRPELPQCLTREFERKIRACDRPGLVYPGEADPPVEAGQIIKIGSSIEIEILRLRKTKGGDHRAIYTVHDHRPTLIRRTPPMHEPPETDAEGFPLPHDEAAIKAASIDGNYTQDQAQAVPESASEVDIEFRRLLSVKKRTADAEGEAPEAIRRKQERATRDKLRETLKGLDPPAQAALLARVEKVIEEAGCVSV
ncbi:MAG TPA: hypothetical protein VFX35_12525 [Solirubrobacterales bacterium]|nr:hypothetical protein [Solirubrobacterales bacterium]